MENSGLPVRLGVSPLSWSNDVLEDLGRDIQLETCLREASEIGYEGVELGREFPRNSTELLPKLSEYGLQLIAGWYSGFLAERSLGAEWVVAAAHLRLLEECGSQVLVYGEINQGFIHSLDPAPKKRYERHLKSTKKQPVRRR